MYQQNMFCLDITPPFMIYHLELITIDDFPLFDDSHKDPRLDINLTIFQVFFDLMREIRSRKAEADKQTNDKKSKKKKSKKKCTIL